MTQQSIVIEQTLVDITCFVEFLKIYGLLKVDPWLSSFAIDYAIYKGRYDEALVFTQKVTDISLVLQKYIRIVNLNYILKNYSVSNFYF